MAGFHNQMNLLVVFRRVSVLSMACLNRAVVYAKLVYLFARYVPRLLVAKLLQLLFNPGDFVLVDAGLSLAQCVLCLCGSCAPHECSQIGRT